MAGSSRAAPPSVVPQRGPASRRPGSAPAPATRVALLSEARWPRLPGVCCWRYAVRAAFGTAGAEVVEVPWEAPPVPPAPAGAARSRPRLPWLPGPVRQPLVFAYRALNRPGRVLAGRRWAAGRDRHVARQRQAVSAQLHGVAVVIAESGVAAAAAVRAGVPGSRIWALALPPAWRWHPGPDSAAGMAAAGEIAGLLTDSELAREALERATAAGPVRVEVFPPVVPDRVCPACGSSGHPRSDPAPADQPPEPRQLADWWSMSSPPVGLRYTFAAARRWGLGAGWAPADRPDWPRTAATSPVPGWGPDAPPEWSAEAQVRAARAVLATVLSGPAGRSRPSRTTLVTGFDLKFARELAEHLDHRPDLDVTLDEWPGLAQRSPETARLVSSADSILAEWARPSAAWLSREKSPGQVLVVRLHRYELDFPYPRDIDIDNVDAMVYVSPPIGRRIRAELGWPADKLVHIPNFLAVARFDRPKLPDARFGLGMVGVEWMNKRLDLALDLLAAVRLEDRRYTLFVRSVPPWENRYAWERSVERDYVSWCYERIEHDPLLRGAVSFDPPGRDMARWYRRVGHVLSMSDIESFHLAAAEGMASGAVPVIRPWPGAEEIYSGEWIHSSVEAAAAAVLANSDPDAWREQAGRAKVEIARKVDPAAVVNAWADLLRGDLAAARSHFPDRAEERS